MHIKKQFIAITVLTAMVTGGIAAVNAPASAHKNLQILPKDISDQKLDSIMLTYNKALGVGCDFCHSAHKTIKDSLDYASDAHGMKEEAHKMMRMTISINKNNFYVDSTIRPEYLNIVDCYTCHRGEPYPVR